MCKCSTCGKEIKNSYFLDGKVYGYNCYQMALALKYAKMQELKNDEYARKCSALIEVYSSKNESREWNKNFQTSILSQWSECKKLTAKQFDCILSKFNEIENIEYCLIYLELNRVFSVAGVDPVKNYFYKLLNSDILKIFKDDERLHNFIKDYKQSSIEKGKKFYIVESKDEYEKESIHEILSNKQLEELQEDEDITIIETVNI